MAGERPTRLGWLERRREQRRLKQERTGPSSEKAAERHEPRGGVIDVMLKGGGIERESRFKK